MGTILAILYNITHTTILLKLEFVRDLGVYKRVRDLLVLPKYQPKRGGDLGWGKLFLFKCGIKNYFQLAKKNLRTQFNCNIDMIENQTQAYISNWISKR